MRRHAFAILLFLSASAGSIQLLADAQFPGASAPEFQVSTYVPPRYSYSFRFGPAADLADSGDFMVVWASELYVAGRPFDPGGNPRGGELNLGNGTLGYFPESPDVAAGSTQFVVVWSSYEPAMGGSTYTVKAQRFDLQGQPEGPLLKVSPGYHEIYGEIAVEPGGDFIVVWEWGFFARGRRFDSTGSPSWPEQTMGVAGQIGPDPDIAVDELGRHTVVWSHETTTEPRAVFARRFDSAGTLLNPTTAVSEYPTGSQRQPAIAARPDGGFVAVWRSTQDGSNAGVFGRIFDGFMQPMGGEFLVNTTTIAFQDRPDVGADDRGNFVVVWNSGASYGRGDHVMGQRFDPAGNRVGGEFRISETFATGQRLPTIGMRGDGEFLVTWHSTQADCCTGGASVRARCFCATPNVVAPAGLSVCEGDPAGFDVSATGRGPFSHQWRKDDLPLLDDGRISGAASSSLSLASADPADAGLYDCQVTDGCESPQSLRTPPAQLSVVPRPDEVPELSVEAAGSGTLLHFTWSAAGNAADYVVRSDTMPGGAFADSVGSAAGPEAGLTVPMPAETRFFLIAGRSPVCGEGPLR